ncbi:membrane-bound lytic murein transglycosylase D [Catalinimonas alkaloidigena]|uniref:Membrane-bound lytic murein transglycosylase D n=1 Tax=Catalinimonas alkaloidigena TaxID=1075417 RepID=A0A1G9JC74_9BACT|nr:LysM peptidoglycan-binding domain-containing protein [Catalinimonas alkaloidigena]SDL34892.1 membrane-bound lytic murein transglycosylase D [Catalinimonas alkaloidigena]
MTRPFLSGLLTLLCCCSLWAQSVEVDVPTHLQFADLELTLTTSARRKIKADAEALRRSPKFFQIKVDRADAYFPIIDRIFAEEGIPADFRYLVLQESGLISDAVSSSKAVGYWQFKEASATEVGMRVDRHVDERKNIVSSTLGAARYLKRNNAALNNWLTTLLSYNMGLGGARKVSSSRDVGARRVTIDGNTHWYILKFLSHKLAFEDAIGQNQTPPLRIVEYPNAQGKTLKEIAEETNLNYDEVVAYNKWLNTHRVPDDGQYVVALPVPGEAAAPVIAQAEPPVPSTSEPPPAEAETDLKPWGFSGRREPSEPEFYALNGRKAIKARGNDNVATLAMHAKISRQKFMAYNDLRAKDKVQAGHLYYLKKKWKRAKTPTHVVKAGETLWSISQKHGVRLDALMEKNRVKNGYLPIQPGTIISLRKKRKKKDPPVKLLPASAAQPTTPVAETQPTTRPATAATSEVRPTAPPTTEKNQSGAVSVTTKSATSTPEHPDEHPRTAEKATTSPPETATPTSPSPSVEEGTMVVRTDPKPPVEAETQTTPTPPPATEASSVAWTEHVVEKGESLYSISRKYAATIDDLMAWNQLASNNLSIGQTLRIRTETVPDDTRTEASAVQPNAPAESVQIHEVQTGDTLWGVARAYGVTVAQLKSWNHKTDGALTIGEKLVIRREK